LRARMIASSTRWHETWPSATTTIVCPDTVCTNSPFLQLALLQRTLPYARKVDILVHLNSSNAVYPQKTMFRILLYGNEKPLHI
jgi:hypothetical protein